LKKIEKKEEKAKLPSNLSRGNFQKVIYEKLKNSI